MSSSWQQPADPPRPRHVEASDHDAHSHDAQQAESDDVVIRPFLLTGGRTRPAMEGLQVEALILSQPGISLDSLRFETRQIVQLCQQAISVAELSARLRVPLGVVRVLVSDLIADGCVTLVRRQEMSVQLIERIRDRVRAL